MNSGKFVAGRDGTGGESKVLQEVLADLKRITRDPPDTLDRLWMGEHCDNFVLHLQQHQLAWQNRLLDKNSPKLSNVFYCECECRLFFFSLRHHLNKDISCFETSVGSWCAEAKHLLIKNGSGITCTNFPCLGRW